VTAGVYTSAMVIVVNHITIFSGLLFPVNGPVNIKILLGSVAQRP
jgi:hypothetical protein